MRFGVCVLLLIVTRPALAQERVTLRSDLLLYGDNTEFRNPFREGDTLFGAAVRVAFDVDLNAKATVSLGVFGNQRFGSDKAFEHARPVIALTVRGRRSSFVFGTFPALGPDGPAGLSRASASESRGPDRGGPHGLLPPLQRETLAFDRPYEAGLQWDFKGARLRHEVWLEWQRLNTPEHRERFDGGLNAEVTLTPHISVPLQLHVVHEGGQLFNTGPVADSAAGAAGIALRGRTRNAGVVTLELFGAGSRSVPDRQRPDLRRNGKAFFGRAAAEHDGWRVHLLFWRGNDFIKDEGDPNYLSIRLNGTRYGGTRDYAETGVARRFKLAPGAVIEVSGRFHRTERHYEYSYRVLSIASLGWKLR
jgi:hypothetical protein